MRQFDPGMPRQGVIMTLFLVLLEYGFVLPEKETQHSPFEFRPVKWLVCNLHLFSTLDSGNQVL